MTLRIAVSVVLWEKILSGVHSGENETAKSGEAENKNAFEKFCNKENKNWGRR